MKCRVVALSTIIFCCSVFSLKSMAGAIDLNDFFADPTVTVSPDGSSGLMLEDPGFFSVLLSNDPGLGDPNVIIPGSGLSLFFDYDFLEGPLGDDEFGAFLIDGITGAPLGASAQFFTTATSNGSVSFELTPYDGQLLGLTFQLFSFVNDLDFDSRAIVSNVRIGDSESVPAPGILYLFFLGGTLLVGFCRKR